MKLKHTKVATLAATLITFGSLAGGANAAVFVQPMGITTSDSLTGGTSINNIIQATSLSFTEFHQGVPAQNDNQVWIAGNNANLSVTVDLGSDYDLVEFYFWNDSQAGWAVDDISMTFLNSLSSPVGNWSGTAAMGVNPSVAETFSISASSVRFVDVTFSGRSSGVEPTDLAFGAVPEPSSVLLLGLGALGFFARRKRIA